MAALLKGNLCPHRRCSDCGESVVGSSAEGVTGERSGGALDAETCHRQRYQPRHADSSVQSKFLVNCFETALLAETLPLLFCGSSNTICNRNCCCSFVLLLRKEMPSGYFPALRVCLNLCLQTNVFKFFSHYQYGFLTRLTYARLFSLLLLAYHMSTFRNV